MAKRIELKICPCCRRPFPFASDAVQLQGKVQRRYFDAIVNSPEGLTTERLMSIVYADDPNGGPIETGVVKATIFTINRRLKPYGMKIFGGEGGHGARYRLVPL